MQPNSLPLRSLVEFLEQFAPTELAEDWDNVGLLLGDREAHVRSVLTCLTITSEVVDEAIDKQVDLIVTHHPLPFRPLKKITTDSIPGKLVWRMANAGIAVYSPHTAFDSTTAGINQSIAERLGLNEIEPIRRLELSTSTEGDTVGVGRMGSPAQSLSCRELGQQIREQFQLSYLGFCGNGSSPVSKVGIACGSAGQFLAEAKTRSCDAFITGEATFHTCLEAKELGVSLFLMGHYGSERFALELLAERISKRFPELEVAASHQESNPIEIW